MATSKTTPKLSGVKHHPFTVFSNLVGQESEVSTGDGVFFSPWYLEPQGRT